MKELDVYSVRHTSAQLMGGNLEALGVDPLLPIAKTKLN